MMLGDPCSGGDRAYPWGSLLSYMNSVPYCRDESIQMTRNFTLGSEASVNITYFRLFGALGYCLNVF